MKLRQELLGNARRIVVKLGTGVLTDSHNKLAHVRIEALAAQVVALREQKRQVLLVSSGAIAAGMSALGFSARPKHLHELQAAAAIGQGKLMAMYDAAFGRFGVAVAQVLLTHDDLKSRQRHLNARNTLDTLLARGVVPVINENDTVAIEEIKFGDNDRLGALTATLADADLLVILSHVEGLYSRMPMQRDYRPDFVFKDEKGKSVVVEVKSTIRKITPEIERLAGGTKRATSIGGMVSKIEAAKIVARAGIPMIIASGERPNVLIDLLAGEELGTLFLPSEKKLGSRKRWIAFFQKPAGALVVDDGARTALCDAGKSLLAKGVVRTEGKVTAGDVVSIQDSRGVEFARGLLRDGSVVVHRDDLVIL